MSKNLAEIYQDYEVQPYISPERDLEVWLRNPKPVPKRNMVKLTDGLLAGDIILLWRIQFGTFTTASTFPKYFEYTYGIDAPARLKMLLEQDYARVQTAFESLPHLNTTEKKAVLKTKSVPGISKMKVADLDRALAEHLTEEELSTYFSIRGYVLTAKGAQALLDNQAVVDRHPKKNI